MEKQLRRSKKGAVLGGVAGGVAQYFNIDVVIIRLLFVISLFMSFGISLLAYIVLWVVLPEDPLYQFGQPMDMPDTVVPQRHAPVENASNGDRNLKIVAIGLIAFGCYMLLDQFVEWYHIAKYFWPISLIGLGAFLLLRKRDQDDEANASQQMSTPPQNPSDPSDSHSPSDTSGLGSTHPDTGNSGEESFKVN